MVRILHTADVHLGAKFSGLGDKGATQREQIRSTFAKLVRVAIDEKADIVLIAGDLFDDNRQPQRNVDFVVQQFQILRTHGIAVCLIPGTHDCFDNSSIYRRIDFEQACPNVSVFRATEGSFKEFPELSLTVYGKPNISNRSRSSPVLGLQPLTGTKFHVAMAHGSFLIPGRTSEDDHVFRPEELDGCEMDYVALGHWHRTYQCPTNVVMAYYPGPPEWPGGDQAEPGYVLLVELEDAGPPRVAKRKVGLRDYDEREIAIDDIRETAELRATVCEGAHPDLVRKVRFKGLRSSGLAFDLEELERDWGSSFFHLSLVDESHLRIEDLSSVDFQERLISARFVQLMQGKIDSSQEEEQSVAEEALQVGIALLQGREVL